MKNNYFRLIIVLFIAGFFSSFSSSSAEQSTKDALSFFLNDNGGVLYIKAKKAQENILKQTAQGLIEEFSSEINRISL